jgi:hypothetical protein
LIVIAPWFQIVDGKRYFQGQAVPDAQPKFFTGGILRDYQVEGFQWLVVSAPPLIFL